MENKGQKLEDYIKSQQIKVSAGTEYLSKNSAPDILANAKNCISNRAEERDIEQERSMAQTVRAFKELRGHDLSEEDGWIFMAVLKMVRARAGTKINVDDYVDGAAYIALAGEAKCGRTD